jgi:hypothetical protein
MLTLSCLSPVLSIYGVGSDVLKHARPGLLILGAMIVAGLAWHHLVLSRRPGGWRPELYPASPQ